MKKAIYACLFFSLTSLLLNATASDAPNCNWQIVAPKIKNKIIRTTRSYSKGVAIKTVNVTIQNSRPDNYLISVSFSNKTGRNYEIIGITYSEPQTFGHKLASNKYKSYCLTKNIGNTWAELIDAKTGETIASIPGRYFNLSLDI